MLDQFSRTELLIGKEGLDKLKNAKVAIFGIGGVGSFVVEALVRAGVFHFVLVDHDKICSTNLNRQIHATTKTIGKYKVEVMRDRILEINPEASVEIYQEFYLSDSKTKILDESISYVADCIDTVTAKIALIVNSQKLNIPIISSMGTGNKLNPTKLEVSDIYKTNICPLAKVMRKELKKRNIEKLKVVYSKEEPIRIDTPLDNSYEQSNLCPADTEKKGSFQKQVPGSISFVPSVAGLIIAGEIVTDIINLKK